MRLLGIDVGSAAVKVAVLNNGKVQTPIARQAFPTRFQGVRAEVPPAAIMTALARAVAELGPPARSVDAILLANMAPSWIAVDKRGKALTPIITHQDRRSVALADELETTLGKSRLLRLSGNRPFPGGISSTTYAWFIRHEPALMKKADLVGHLNTYLHRQITGARVTDPSNASFMGLYSTLTLSGWNPELIDAAGGTHAVLPEVVESHRVAGRVTRAAAADLRLTHGTPMIVGCMDGSAAMLLGGAKVGQLMDVCGSTDVLALCTDRPRPHERLLTRALGIGRRWMSVSTLAAAGSAFAWVKDQLFAELSIEQFWKMVRKLARCPLRNAVRFEPYLAGDRMSIQQRQGAFIGLTLSTTRLGMLSAVIESLAHAGAERLPLLRQGGVPILPTVMLSGGMHSGLDQVMRRDWPGRWRFQREDEATLRGLGSILPCDR